MKQTITTLTLFVLTFFKLSINAQTQTVTFDNFSLPVNSYFLNSHDTLFRDGAVTFRYGAGFGFWLSGTAYTNVKDTSDGTFNNLYGCAAYNSFSGNNNATVQNGAIITFSTNSTLVSGFYITNTTYAWKTIKNGDSFSRKFGDTTGTHSGGSIAQGEYPDWFKVLVRGYRGGNLLTDSIEFYLADYRAAGTVNDYIVKNWQFVNCSSLGVIDSLTFELKSSDVGQFGMNTPAFFSIDDLTITQNPVGIAEISKTNELAVYPNPSRGNVKIPHKTTGIVSVYNLQGEIVLQHTFTNPDSVTELETGILPNGIYIVELNSGNTVSRTKFVKH